jgi:amidophosphoribosyltransferase
MGGLGEECGIAGVYLKNGIDKKAQTPRYLYSMLSKIQHRGQLSAGISVYNPESKGGRILSVHKAIGKVDDLFDVKDQKEYKKILRYSAGTAGIGHVRYSTSGNGKNHLALLNEAQPFFRHHGRPWKRFSLAFNGNLANADELRKEITESEKYIFDTEVDTEAIMHLLSINLKALSTKDGQGRDMKPDLFDVFGKVAERLDGACNLVSLFSDGDLVVFRDAFGFKPLVWGENSDAYAVASESTSLEGIGINNFYPVPEGNCMIFNRQGIQDKKISDSLHKSHCHFEWVYFSRAQSVIDNKSVNSVRENLGKELAKIEPLKQGMKQEEYVVVPVPKTAIPAAEEYAHEMGIRFSLALDKAHGERGFINKSNERERIMDKEYGIFKERVKDKKVIVIEDSIVRGETSKKIIRLLRDAGAKEVHFRSTEPPIVFPCFYGIDFPTYKELIASKYSDNLEIEIAKEIGADSVVYQTLEGLVNAIGFPKNDLCLACLTGKYPTPGGKMLAEKITGHAI